MAIFLMVSEGSDPGDTVPLLASSDPRLIAAVMRELKHILGLESPSARDLRPTKPPTTLTPQPKPPVDSH